MASMSLRSLASNRLSLLDAALLFATVPVPQLLTPDLAQLYSLGPTQYAERLPRRFEIDPAERAKLEAAEAAMAEQALRRFRKAFPELDPI